MNVCNFCGFIHPFSCSSVMDDTYIKQRLHSIGFIFQWNNFIRQQNCFNPVEDFKWEDVKLFKHLYFDSLYKNELHISKMMKNPNHCYDLYIRLVSSKVKPNRSWIRESQIDLSLFMIKLALNLVIFCASNEVNLTFTTIQQI